MNWNLLQALSNADAVASNETAVRTLLKEALADYADTFTYDGLGSLMVTKAATEPDRPTIMFAAHMDEVGFMIRNLSAIGFAYLQPLGNVEDRAKSMQLVRAHTQAGQVVEGLLNITRDASGQVADMYVDFGFDSREALLAAGLEIGDVVCFASDYRELSAANLAAGKAMDDRAGCFALVQAMKALKDVPLAVNVVAAFTSSEEVGTRGGRTTTALVAPDVFFAIDVAKHPELDRGFTDHRVLGAGPMFEFYDKTMVPNRALLTQVQAIAQAANLPYQKDMFKGGGTDAGTAHLEHGGTAAMVIGLPLRYCHDPYSFVNKQDVVTTATLIEQIARQLDAKAITKCYQF
ncbi:aminopeptidase [Lacticaseibacillus daqingensis]|uniref:aminopeptidase n=1 Tax=Lacticaseibacillus daqingensis TaxID=2486014 RepID=UPI000F7B3C35|nr:aminopeptidase [Lacticaseibacillus daqingensis]